MQTFVPYPDFYQSVVVLDNKRLGKQRVETYQIASALTSTKLENTHEVIKTGRMRYFEDDDGIFVPYEVTKRIDLPRSEWRVVPTTGKGWSDHAVTRMWVGFEPWLMDYQEATCRAWAERGYKDTCLEKTRMLLESVNATASAPHWIGREDVHASHRANLLRKDPIWYSQFGWTEEPRDGYVWPV